MKPASLFVFCALRLSGSQFPFGNLSIKVSGSQNLTAFREADCDYGARFSLQLLNNLSIFNSNYLDFIITIFGRRPRNNRLSVRSEFYYGHIASMGIGSPNQMPRFRIPKSNSAVAASRRNVVFIGTKSKVC